MQHFPVYRDYYHLNSAPLIANEFEGSNASEEVLAEIVTAISTHSNLEELDLDENYLGRDGSVAFGERVAGVQQSPIADCISL
jgi:hypothetical protein